MKQMVNLSFHQFLGLYSQFCNLNSLTDWPRNQTLKTLQTCVSDLKEPWAAAPVPRAEAAPGSGKQHFRRTHTTQLLSSLLHKILKNK